jgi:hypothetical protein
MQHEVLTHHCIDDLPAWDQAMDQFRQLFPMPSYNVYVFPDGKKMRYRLRGAQNVELYLRMARLTILMHKLPLAAERDTFAIGGVVFEDHLYIIYRPQ